MYIYIYVYCDYYCYYLFVIMVVILAAAISNIVCATVALFLTIVLLSGFRIRFAAGLIWVGRSLFGDFYTTCKISYLFTFSC